MVENLSDNHFLSQNPNYCQRIDIENFKFLLTFTSINLLNLGGLLLDTLE
jgi:hypothetical protein